MTNKRLRSETQAEAEQIQSSQRLASFTKADVPSYLHGSEFYLSLEEDDEQQILVPRECFKKDDVVTSAGDLRSLLLTLRFWVVDGVVDSILDFVFSRSFETYEEVIAEFYDDMPDLKYLKAIMTAKKPFRKAINSDVFAFVRYMHNTGKYAWPDDACAHLAEKGLLRLLKYAIDSGCTLTIEATVAAATYGHLPCLRLLHEHNCPWDEGTTNAAAFYDRLDCLQYAHENGCPWRDSVAVYDELWDNVCTVAAARGYLECLKYAHTQGVQLSPAALAITISSKRDGALECLKYLHSHGLPLDDEQLCAKAVWANNLEILKYLHENGCPWNRDSYMHATNRCETNVLDYLHTNGCPWDALVCVYAAINEDLDNVLYFLRNGCPPSDNIWAFKGDQFYQIYHAYEEAGLPWTATPGAMLFVVGNGDLDAVKLMREKGFPWRDNSCTAAAMTGSLELLEYVHTDGATFLTTECAALMENWERRGRYTTDKLACFKYAHQHGNCPLFKSYTFQAARDGQLELLTYLHEQGCKWDAKAAVAAAKNGHADCLEYLLSQGCPHSKDIVIVAARRRQDECLEVAKKFGCV